MVLPTRPVCAVVIPCRNEAANITAVLDALTRQSRPPDQLVLVNDRSSDATAEVVRAWHHEHADARLQLIEGPGRGPGPAMNAGIRATDADVIMRFDGHAVPDREYLARCLDVLAEGAGVVGGVWQIRPGAETAVAHAIAGVVSHPLGSGGARYRGPGRGGPVRQPVETVPFGTFRRSLWEQLGGFDETLAVNEDFDFNYRARRAGVDVVLDSRISATYLARPTLQALARQYFRYGFWKARMLRKHPGAIHWRQVPPAGVGPWIAMTLLCALVWPGLWSATVAALYPAVLLAGGMHVALTRAVHPLAAVAAMATVHLSWSAGFWVGGVGRR